MEGQIYNANWKKIGKKYLIYLEQNQSLRATHMDFSTAYEELCLSICEAYGDGEAALNILRDPPEPEGVSKYANPTLVTLSWNESCTGQKWQDGIFENGYCDDCKAGLGARTNKLLEVSEVPKSIIGSFNQTMFSPILLSTDFISVLTDEEISNLELQEILSSNSINAFYEVKGTPVFKQVGVKGARYNSVSSWQCASCGHKSFSCFHPEMPNDYKYTNFCCIDDLPRNIDEIFIIEDNIGRKKACMSLKRWKTLKVISQFGGISANRLYALPYDQIERDPSVRLETKAN